MLDEVRIASIEQAITAQEAQGQNWTNQSIYDFIDGGYTSLSQYLKARRATARRSGRGGTAVAEADQTPLLLVYPLVHAFKAYREAAGVERELGEHYATLKKRLQALTGPLALIRSAQARAHDETTVAQYEVGLATREKAITDAKTQLAALQQSKVQANADMMQTQNILSGLQERAKAALRQCRVALRASTSDPSALEHYKVLESLVGPDETLAALHNNQQPEWLQG